MEETWVVVWGFASLFAPILHRVATATVLRICVRNSELVVLTEVRRSTRNSEDGMELGAEVGARRAEPSSELGELLRDESVVFHSADTTTHSGFSSYNEMLKLMVVFLLVFGLSCMFFFNFLLAAPATFQMRGSFTLLIIIEKRCC